MVQDGTIDWAMGETLAIGSLLTDGVSVRLAGQDSRRGTFGQRHMVIIDRKTGWAYKPLKRCYEKGAKLYVYDSPLSEFAAMGFEYGYCVARPEALVMWEAQFGDFANGAQTIIDEFISSGEQKWGQRSGLVLLLPHGHEGQGPDHSSARIERFLQLCAQDNMTIANLTTPANYFHLLRWQALSPTRRPLVVFTPKSMLRLKAAASQAPMSSPRGTSTRSSPTRIDADGVRKVLAVQRQGLLRPAEVPRRNRAHRHRRSSGWSGSTRCRPTRRSAPSPATATLSCAGCRKNRPTKAPGRSWGLHSPRRSASRSRRSRARRARHRPPARHTAHEREQRALVEAAFA